MNNVSLIGNLVRDPEVRWNADNAIARFTIAIESYTRRDGSKQVDYPKITVFGKQAENVEKYVHKGSKVGVTGRIQTGSYVKDTGEKIYTTDVVADRVEFLSRSEASEKPSETTSVDNEKWEQLDADIPF